MIGTAMLASFYHTPYIAGIAHEAKATADNCVEKVRYAGFPSAVSHPLTAMALMRHR